MAKQHIEVNFGSTFQGTLKSERGQVPIGKVEGGMSPYDLILGGLASCLYATFLEVADKKKISFESTHVYVEGSKRETIPTTLETVHVKLTVLGASQESGLIKAMDLATKYCSVYQTLQHVAEMSYEIVFE